MPGIIPPGADPRDYMTPQPQSNAAQVAAFQRKAAMVPRTLVQTPLGPASPTKPFSQQPVRTDQSPIGGEHPFATRATTQFVQAQLKHMGYNVGIDGVAGPQTTSAYKAYLAGVHPNAWAEAYSANHQPVAPHDPPPSAHGTPPPPPGHGPVGLPDLPPGRAPAGVAAAVQDGLIDPEAFARSSADATYNPQINELVRQMADAKAQQGATQSDIKDWYAKLVGDTGSAASANAADASKILAGQDSAAAGLVAALGGSASAGASDVGANAAIGRNELESLGLNNSSFERNLGSAYAGEGVTALGDEGRQYRNDLQTALGKKSDLLGAKGDAYTTALQSALVQRTNQAKTQMDTTVEGNLAGIQTKQAAANLAGTVLSNNINKWRYEQGIKDAATGGAGSVPEFTKQNPGQLNQLSGNLLNGILGPKGNFNSDPAQAFQKMSGTLSTLSYGKWNPQTNPAARNFVTGLIQSRLAAWNAQNPQKKYAVKNGAVVRI